MTPMHEGTSFWLGLLCGIWLGLLCGILGVLLVHGIVVVVTPDPIEDPTNITILSYASNTDKQGIFYSIIGYYVYTSEDKIYQISARDYLRISSLSSDDFPYSADVIISHDGSVPYATFLNFSREVL